MTTCAQDIITDLNAESEILPLEPVNEDWKGHKVQKSTHPGYCVFASPFKQTFPEDFFRFFFFMNQTKQIPCSHVQNSFICRPDILLRFHGFVKMISSTPTSRCIILRFVYIVTHLVKLPLLATLMKNLYYLFGLLSRQIISKVYNLSLGKEKITFFHLPPLRKIENFPQILRL